MNMYEICVLTGLQKYCAARINCVKSIFYNERKNKDCNKDVKFSYHTAQAFD